MLLEPDQKALFARWLQVQINSNEQIVAQFAKLGMAEALYKREQTEQIACKVVLRMLTDGESMTIARTE